MKPLGVPANASVGAHAPDFEVAWVLQRRQPLGVRTWRRSVEGGGRFLTQRLVGALLVVLATESVEASLLRRKVGLRRAGRLFLKSAMHPFMTGVLLWMGRLDQNGQDAQPDPPDRQGREPSDGDGGKGSAVIRANSQGKTVFPEQSLEDRLALLRRARAQRLTTQKVSAQTVGSRQRVAVTGVPGSELTLEVRRPQVVGLQDREEATSWMLHPTAEGPASHQTMALEDLSGRTGCWPGLLGTMVLQPGDQLLRSPAGMPSARLQNPTDDLLGRPVRRTLRCPRTLLQPVQPFLLEPLHPLVPRLAADPVQLCQLRHRKEPIAKRRNQLHSLPHRCRLAPRHLVPPQSSSCAKLSPMSPVQSVTHVPGLYPSVLRPRSLSRAGTWPGCGARSLPGGRRRAPRERSPGADEPEGRNPSGAGVATVTARRRIAQKDRAAPGCRRPEAAPPERRAAVPRRRRPSGARNRRRPGAGRGRGRWEASTSSPARAEGSSRQWRLIRPPSRWRTDGSSRSRASTEMRAGFEPCPPPGLRFR